MSAGYPREIPRAGAALVLCLLSLVWKAGVPDSTFHMEVMSLMPSQETWLRGHEGGKRAWIVPSWNGRPRLNKPPMLVWLNLLAWSDMRPESATVDDLIWRARLLSAGLACLGLLAVYAMGRFLGGRPLAWRAALAAGTTLFFIRQGRLASYDTHLFSWVSVAVAFIWQAARKARLGERPPAGAWGAALLAGAALALAVLTKGPIAFLFVLVPAASILWALGPPRKPSFKLVLMMAATTFVLVSPWYAYVLHEFPGAGRVLLSEYRQARQNVQFPLYYLVLLALAFPWGFSLAGACGAFFSRPFRKSLAGKEWIPFVWLLGVLLVLSLPEAKRERYVFPALPAAGLLIAQGWHWLEEHVRARGAPAGWQRLLLDAHFGVLLACSAAVAVYPPVQDVLLGQGLLKEAELPGLDWKTALPAGLVLFCLASWAFRSVRACRFDRAFALTAVWTALASAFVLNFYVHSHHGRYGGRTAAEETAKLARGISLFWLCLDPATDKEPDQKFLLYSRRIIPRIGPEDLKGFVESNLQVAVIAASDERHDRVLSGLGLKQTLAFNDGRQSRTLFMSDESHSAEAAAPEELP